MEGSTLTQRRAECQLKEREIQTDYMMELGARLALVRQIQREQEKEMKRIWFETRKMPSLIEENVRDVTNRPLTEFMAPCIDSLPPLAFTNRRPIPTMLHPPSPLAIRTQDAQRFIVFSYFVPAECPVSTEATADVSAGKREDLSTDTHLSSMLHRYLPHFFNDDYIPPQQTVEGTTEVSVATVAISNIKEEDRFYPFSLPPLAQRLIGNSFNVPETSQLAVSATEYRVAKEATAGTATVKRENRWAARILPSVLPPCLPPVFDNDYKLPGAAVEGINKCPVASEAAASVPTVLQEEFLTDNSPPAPTALSLRLPCTHNIDHKQPEEIVENTTECSVDIEACAVASTVKREELMGDKSPVHALPPSLACIHDKDHKLPDQKGRGTTEEVDICSHTHQLVPDANLTLPTCNDELPTPLICVVTKTPVRVGASICRTEDEEPRPQTLEEAKKQVGTIMHLLTKEAVRKICRLFLEVSAALQNENEKLKIKVEQMDKDLKAMVEKGEGREEPKRPTHILHNGTIFKIKPVDLPMMPVNNVKTNTVVSALLSMGDVSQVNTVIVREETTARNTGSITDPVKERSEVKSGTKTSVIEGAAEAYSKPTETSSLLLSVGDSRGLNTKPSFRDTESKGEPMRAVVPEETGSGRGSHARETSSRTANGTESTENSHGIQQSISKPRKPFKCDICEKTFHANCLLKRHIAVHNKPKGPFKCDICAKTFRLNCMLTQHMQTHSKEKPFSCKVCGKKFRSKTNLKSHEFVHAEVKPFTCLTCGRGFASKYMLDVHQRVHTGEKPYSCTTCGKNFSISQNLKTHIRSVHTERTERPHPCSQCDKTFWRPVELQEHQVVHTGEKPFRCEICQATFSFKENLTRHHRIHTKKRPHTCEACGKTFIQSTNLKAHMLVHGALKPFMCDVCGKTYLYNYQLRIHKLSHVADGEGHSRTRKNKANQQKQTDQPKPFSCEICLKGFSSIGSLKTHGRIHTGENIYTCSTCGKTFLHKVTFDYHQKLHTGEKPNACGCCGKRFITKQSLKIHELIHTGEKPHKCSDCGKTFGFIGNLKRHERVHTGEKPFSCDVCGTRFRQANHVKTHMQVHTGVRPYSCKRCGKGFSDSRHFKKHNCVSS